MSSSEAPDPRYPIGPLESRGRALTPEERAELIEAIASHPVRMREAVAGLDDEPLAIDTVFTADGGSFPFGAHIAVAKVDTETGRARLYEAYESVEALQEHIRGPVFTDVGPELLQTCTFLRVDAFGDFGDAADEPTFWPTTFWGPAFAALTD